MTTVFSTTAVIVALASLGISSRALLDSFWREIEIGAGAWWEG